MPQARSTQDVFDDHLRLALKSDVEGDIAANYAQDVVLLTGAGVLRGHAGVRRSREILAEDLPSGTFEYLTRLVDDEIAFLEWRGDADAVTIDDGADSFLVRDGLIRVQTIHYTLRHRTGYHSHIEGHPAD